MPRGKSSKLAPYEKILTILISGKAVTIEELDTLLGKEIHMYRLSTYMWHIKTNVNGVVKSIKDGRKVTAYQLINVDEVKKSMDRSGVTKSGFIPGQTQKKDSVAKTSKKAVTKLADLNAKPVKTKTKTKVETTPVVEASGDEIVVTEITESDNQQ
jgi:hypothetical protein